MNDLVVPARIYRKITETLPAGEASEFMSQLQVEDRPWGRGERVFVTGPEEARDQLAEVLRAGRSRIPSGWRRHLDASLAAGGYGHRRRPRNRPARASRPAQLDYAVEIIPNGVVIPLQNGARLTLTYEVAS